MILQGLKVYIAVYVYVIAVYVYVKYTCSIETVQQNGRFTLFSSKFPSNIYSILYDYTLAIVVIRYL